MTIQTTNTDKLQHLDLRNISRAMGVENARMKATLILEWQLALRKIFDPKPSPSESPVQKPLILDFNQNLALRYGIELRKDACTGVHDVAMENMYVK